MVRELGYELIYLERQNKAQWHQIEKYRIKTANYKALFFGRHELAEKMQTQEEENHNNQVGEFDGFCYSSSRANAKYRTLEDMLYDGIISSEEYEFANEKY